VLGELDRGPVVRRAVEALKDPVDDASRAQ
jgi:hypothetical protein